MTYGEDGPLLKEAKKVLQSRFGLHSLRPPQHSVLKLLLEPSEDVPPRVLAIFPTGGGKSLCYQLPALLFPSSLTVVVSPLLALIKDQVDALLAKGVAAATLNSTQDATEAREVQGRLRAGEIRLLYVSPERFKNVRFLKLLRGLDLALLAIDEAHCVSQWGHSFRPDYLRLAAVSHTVPFPRVLALTATATPAVARGVCERLRIPEDTGIVRVPSARPNLTTRVVRVAPSGACTALQASGARPSASVSERVAVLAERIRTRDPGPTIVYVTLQATAVHVAKMLAERGVPARPYHAGLRQEVRAETQGWFLGDAGSPVVVATIAFGMGIDKPDIRYVYHFNLPSSLDGYVQEIGRAGRDGRPATCEILACADDIPVLEGFARGGLPSLDGCRMVTARLLDGKKEGEIALFSAYDLSYDADVRNTSLAQMIAQLELEMKCAREINPLWDCISCRMTPDKKHLQLSGNAPGKKILDCGKVGKALIHVNVSSTAEQTGIDAADISGILESLRRDKYLVSLQSSKVLSRVEILKETSDLDDLAKKLYTSARLSEQRELNRVAEVLDFVGGSNCHSAVIASRYGDAVDLEGGCGRCENCLDTEGQTNMFSDDLKFVNNRPFDEGRWSKVESQMEIPRNPILMARVAAGITSPWVAKYKLKKLSVFGSMSDTPFPQLLKRGKEACH